MLLTLHLSIVGHIGPIEPDFSPIDPRLLTLLEEIKAELQTRRRRPNLFPG